MNRIYFDYWNSARMGTWTQWILGLRIWVLVWHERFRFGADLITGPRQKTYLQVQFWTSPSEQGHVDQRHLSGFILTDNTRSRSYTDEIADELDRLGSEINVIFQRVKLSDKESLKKLDLAGQADNAFNSTEQSIWPRIICKIYNNATTSNGFEEWYCIRPGQGSWLMRGSNIQSYWNIKKVRRWIEKRWYKGIDIGR